MALRPFPFVWKSIKFSCLWGRSSELLGRDIRKEHSALLSGLQHLRKTVRKQEHSDHLKNTYLKGSLASHRSAVEKKTERENNRGEAGSKKRKQDQLFCSNTLTYSLEPLIPQEMRLLQIRASSSILPWFGPQHSLERTAHGVWSNIVLTWNEA